MKKILPLILATICFSCDQVEFPISVIPQPYKVHPHTGSFVLNNTGYIVASDSLASSVEYLILQMEKIEFTLQKSNKPIGDIYIDANHVSDNPEAYRININGARIQISGASKIGIIRAISTLRQIGTVEGSSLTFPRIEIVDKPRFSYRGLQLDVSRHFYDVDQVKEVIDYMTRYKLNKFHWHLTDDQGWRIEIKKYPALTEIGAWRKLNNQDRQCQTYEQIYFDPSFRIPRKYLKVEKGDTIYGGFYTQEQIGEVVQYAADRGIDVIPELDMPGHLMAAIGAYPFISCRGESKWGETFSDPLCVGNEKALQLVKDVYTEVAQLFPYQYMHLGADGVEKINWQNCPKCQALAKKENLDGVEQLQSWFVNDMEKHFNSLGKKLIGWDDIVQGGLSQTSTIMWWRNWAKDELLTATAAGNDAIISPCFSYYFDAWEGTNTFKETYLFEPILDELSHQQAQHIIGVQGNLWTETVPTMERLQNQYFPRIMALAETGWSSKENKNWDNFYKRFINEVNFLDKRGRNYRIPDLKGFYDVNVFIDSITVMPHCDLPNVKIGYTTDLSIPDADSKSFNKPITITQSTTFKFRPINPNKATGEIFTAIYRKETPTHALDVNPTREGIFCRYFKFNGNNCAKIETGEFVSQCAMDTVMLPTHLKGWIGLTFDGYFEAPAKGIYTFKLTSNDGSMLYINNKELINNDGAHGNKAVIAQVALDRGTHKIDVKFFDMHNGGVLNLQWETPNDNDFKVMSGFKY